MRCDGPPIVDGSTPQWMIVVEDELCDGQVVWQQRLWQRVCQRCEQHAWRVAVCKLGLRQPCYPYLKERVTDNSGSQRAGAGALPGVLAASFRDRVHSVLTLAVAGALCCYRGHHGLAGYLHLIVSRLYRSLHRVGDSH